MKQFPISKLVPAKVSLRNGWTPATGAEARNPQCDLVPCKVHTCGSVPSYEHAFLFAFAKRGHTHCRAASPHWNTARYFSRENGHRAQSRNPYAIGTGVCALDGLVRMRVSPHVWQCGLYEVCVVHSSWVAQ